MVQAAMSGDAETGQQAYTILQHTLNAPDLHDEFRTLFVNLRRLLEGERGDDLWQGLPEPIANVIRDLLGYEPL